MLTHGAHAQAERRLVNDERHQWRYEQTQPEKRIVESARFDIPAKSRHPRGIRRAREKKLQEESRHADRKKIYCDANHDLVGAISDRRDRVDDRENESAEHAAQHADPRTAGVVSAKHGSERAAEHEPFEREAHNSGPFGDYTTARSEQIWNRDADHLRKKRQRVHASLRRRAL